MHDDLSVASSAPRALGHPADAGYVRARISGLALLTQTSAHREVPGHKASPDAPNSGAAPERPFQPARDVRS